MNIQPHRDVPKSIHGAMTLGLLPVKSSHSIFEDLTQIRGDVAQLELGRR